MKSLQMVSFLLLVVGGLNWLLTAFGFNLVNMLVGAWPTVEKAVYVLVGLSAIHQLIVKFSGSSNTGGTM